MVKRSWTGRWITFIDTKFDRRIVVEVFHFLPGHFRRKWKQKKGRLRNRQAFRFGMYAGFVWKLREHELTIVSDSPLALIRSSQEAAIADSISANFGSVKSVSLAPEKRASAAVREGFRAGRKTEIRQGVESSKATAVIG